MNRQFFHGGRLRHALLFTLAIVSAQGQITRKDTSGPNVFEFSQGDYFVSRGATSALVSVRFSPGNRGYYGSVAYATEDGSAIAGQDYVPAGGDLFVSWAPETHFSVPLLTNPAGVDPRTIQLVLIQSSNDATAMITRGTAVLHINVPPPPPLEIHPLPGGALRIAWVDDLTSPVLQRGSAPPGTNWTVVNGLPYSDGNGRLYMDVEASEGLALYRLRRAQ